MSNHQEHFGRKFYLDRETGYWISVDYSKDRPRVRAHQWVWICIHGKIPKGYHIHHRNDNKSDNRIENLELIERSRHLSYHMQDPLRKQRMREHADKIRPLTKEWHKSEEGRAWHRLHALKTNFGSFIPFEISCGMCGQKSLAAKLGQIFCSNKCKSAWRRKQGTDDIQVICERCKMSFKKNKYAKTRFCSRRCGKIKSF